jgi:prolyl 4-hydroxylase
MYTGLPLNHQEKAQIVCYDIGGKFNSHYDAQYNSGAAKRKYTCLVYLNDDFEGGETVFDKLGITIKPECGKMVVFKNLDNHDKILETSIHCAKEVRNNNKWICTKWVHSVPTK